MKHSTKFSMLVALLVIAAVTSSCTFIDRLKAGDQLNKGVNAYTNKKHEEAIEHFHRAIELDPQLTDAYLYLGYAYRSQYVPGARNPENLEVAEKAISTFEEVLEKDPDNPTAMAYIAVTYNDLGDYEKAKEWHRKRMQSEAENPEPLYGIGTINWQLAYDKTGQTGENVENLTEEERQEVNRLVEEGIDALKEALEINSQYTDAMQYLNLLYREKAKLAENDEEKKKWQREADQLALQALKIKRQQEEEAEKERRKFLGGKNES